MILLLYDEILFTGFQPSAVHQLQSQLISERVAVLERELAGAKKRERDGQLSSVSSKLL